MGGVNYEGHPWVPPQASVSGEMVQMHQRSIGARKSENEAKNEAISNYAVLQVCVCVHAWASARAPVRVRVRSGAMR